MQRNPLLSYLMRKSGTPPLWLTALFTVGVFAWVIASMRPGLDDMITKGAAMPMGEAWLLIASVLALVGAPMMIGVNAAAFTVRHADPANLKKLRLGDLSRADLAWGYCLATLHRMQIVLTAVIGLAPAMAIGLAEFVLTAYQITGRGALPPPDAVTQWLVTNALVVIGVVGFNFMGAALGTWAALSWGGSLLSTAVTVAGMATATALYVTMALTFELSVPLAIAASVAPYSIGVGLTLLASIERGKKGEEA